MIVISGKKEEIYDFIDNHINCPFHYKCPETGLECNECILKYYNKIKFMIVG